MRSEVRAYALHGVLLGRFRFLVCTVCHRVYHPEETSRAIEEAAKRKGVWGLHAEPEFPVGIVVRDTSRQRFNVFAVPTVEIVDAEPVIIRLKRTAEVRSDPRPVDAGEPLLVQASVDELNSNAHPEP